MATRGNNSDRSVQHVLQVLRSQYGTQHAKAKIEAYRYNSASIRIRIIDPDFKGLSLIERESLIDSILDTLPEDIRAEITLLLLLTPAERKRSLGSMTFDDPTPSRA